MKKLLLLLMCISFLGCVNSEPSDSNVKDVGRAVILQNIKDPTTAKFHHNEQVEKRADNVYIYSETVNATNAFGGSIKTKAIVTVKWNGEKPSKIENWSLLNIEFD